MCQVEARFRRFGLNDEWFHLSGADMEKMKSIVDAAVKQGANDAIPREGYEQLISRIRAMEPEQPEGKLIW